MTATYSAADPGRRPTAEYRQTFALRILSLVILGSLGVFFSLMTFIDKGSVLWLAAGVLCLIGTALTWLNGFKFLVRVYPDKLTRRNLFGEQSVALNEKTKFHHRTIQQYVYGVSAGKNTFITIRNGRDSLKLNSNVKDIGKLQADLMEFERTNVSPAYASLYKSGSRVEFGPISLQSGKLYYKNNSVALRETKNIFTQQGRFKVTLPGKMFAFCNVPAHEIGNINTLFGILQEALAETAPASMQAEKAVPTSEAKEPAAADGNACKQCGSPAVERNMPVPLCQKCRTSLAARPLPVWIKAVSAGLLVVLAFALVKLPDAIKAGVLYERGVKAEEEKKYLTAQNYYKAVADRYPESLKVLVKLYIAYGKNQNTDEATKVFDRIKGRKLSDKELLRQANEMTKSLDAQYAYSDNLVAILKNGQNEPIGNFRSHLEEYVVNNPKDGMGFAELGTVYFRMGMYPEAAASYERATQLSPSLETAWLEAGAAYRQTGEFDKSIQKINKVLAENTENATAWAELARTELKQRQYDAALRTAQKAGSLDDQNGYVKATLAIMYHFNNQYGKRDEVLQQLQKMNYSGYNSTIEIIEGKSKLYQ